MSRLQPIQTNLTIDPNFLGHPSNQGVLLEKIMGKNQAFESFSCFQKNSGILRWHLTIFEGQAIHLSHGKKKNSDTFYLNPGCLIAILVVPPWKYMIPNIHLSGRGGWSMKKLQGAFYPLEPPPRNKKSQLVDVQHLPWYFSFAQKRWAAQSQSNQAKWAKILPPVGIISTRNHGAWKKQNAWERSQRLKICT